MQVKEFTSKPRNVKAVQVTDANMTEVAQWCKGSVANDGGRSFIRVPAHRPQNQRQKEAHVNDWVVQQGKTFKVYLPEPFKASFEEKLKGVHIENLPYTPGATPEDAPIFQQMLNTPLEEIPVSHDQILIDETGDDVALTELPTPSGKVYDLTDIDDVPPPVTPRSMPQRIKDSSFFDGVVDADGVLRNLAE